MKKKIIVVLSIVLCAAAGGYIFIRYHLLKAKDFKPDPSKQKNAIDLRPSVIAKLQQLVKDGSNGLYILSIGKINPGVLTSTVDIADARIAVDSAIMTRLDTEGKLPDDIFSVHLDSLHIDGIGLADLLANREVNIKDISINKPVINVYHKARTYNARKRALKDSFTLYERIKDRVNRISIRNVIVNNGTFVNSLPEHKKPNKFNNIGIRINDVLIDSSTQYDTNRFFYAKQATITCKNYRLPTADSLYYFSADLISVSADQHVIHASNVELNPRDKRKVFESKHKYRTSMYHIVLPKVTLTGVDWWSLMNHQKFITKKVDLPDGSFSIFFDKTLPDNPNPDIHNFPQQLLMKIDMPLAIDELAGEHFHVSYEEYNPKAKAGATVLYDIEKGHVNHISNIDAEIKKHPVATATGRGLFMRHIPVRADFTFNLLKYQTGEFTADIHMDTLDNATVNPLAEPLALCTIRSGKMHSGSTHMKGNNVSSTATLAMAYTSLHIDPLKKADESGQLKKKHVTSLFANVFLIKNANPLHGEDLRQPAYSVGRDHHESFFNFVWITILTGILKTIGIPVKMVIH